MKVLNWILLGVVLAALGCSEAERVPAVPGSPRITFVDIQPRTVVEFQDSIDVVIQYQDTDGDLGHEDPNIHQMEVKDARLENPDTYHMPILTPAGDPLSIEGTLRLKLKNTSLLGSGGDELTNYEIRIRDRAGNWSNTIVTDEIRIVRE